MVRSDASVHVDAIRDCLILHRQKSEKAGELRHRLFVLREFDSSELTRHNKVRELSDLELIVRQLETAIVSHANDHAEESWRKSR
mgnify:CR=1 FL=1